MEDNSNQAPNKTFLLTLSAVFSVIALTLVLQSLTTSPIIQNVSTPPEIMVQTTTGQKVATQTQTIPAGGMGVYYIPGLAFDSGSQLDSSKFLNQNKAFSGVFTVSDSSKKIIVSNGANTPDNGYKYGNEYELMPTTMGDNTLYATMICNGCSAHYTTDLTIQNVETGQANVTVTIYDTDGNLIKTKNYAVDFGGPALQVNIPTEFPELQADKYKRYHAVITSNKKVVGTSWTNDFSGIGSISNPLFSSAFVGKTIYIPEFNKNYEGKTTTLSLANTENQPATTTINFYNNQGSSLGSANLSIAGNARVDYSLSASSNPVFTDGQSISAIIQSDKNIVADIYQYTPNRDDFDIPALSDNLKDTQLYVPIVYKSHGNFLSRIAMMNTGDSAANVTVEIDKQDGTKADSKNYVIPAKGTFTTDMSYFTTIASPAFYSAKVTSDQPLVGQVEHYPTNSKTETRGIALMPLKWAGSTVYSPTVFNKYNGFVSGITVRNVESSPVTVTFDVFASTSTDVTPTGTVTPTLTSTPTPTGTVTPTPTPTPTPTLTPTPSVTLTPTPTPPYQDYINLKVEFDGVTSKPANSANQTVKVYLTDNSGGTGIGSASSPVSISMTPNDQGIYSGVLPLTDATFYGRTFRVRVKGPKHKQIVWSAEVLPAKGGTLDLTDKLLPAGDINGDGVVDSTDLGLVRFFPTDPTEIATTDLNFDGVVDITDRQLILKTLSKNFDEE